MNVELHELYRAYRAAKFEAFRDSNCAHGLKFAEFEAKLALNLAALQKELNRPEPTWSSDLSFIGEVACIPKSIEFEKSAKGASEEIHCQESDPLRQWSTDCGGEKATADFRPVINASVEFAIVSALWVQRVGHLYDERLDTRYAVGNRLRRLRPDKDADPGAAGELHPFSHGLFAPYFTAYGTWRSRGLKTMRQELKDGHRIVAVTMDLKRFYHQVDAAFLLHPDYLKKIGLSLGPESKAFTRHLIKAFETWNAEARKLFDGGPVGLPVGLTASQVIANVLLQEFDHHVARELSPAYYARYVDDVFLVLRHPERFDSGTDFIRWLGQRLAPLTRIEGDSGAADEELSIRVELSYAKKSDLRFVGTKQKIFQLSGPDGLDLIGPIEEQIREQSSEHRSMPALPENEKAMAHRALLVSSDASLSADALRKADAVTLRRSGFAMLLSDIEAYARDLEPETWKDLRQEFTKLVARQLRSPKSFFDYSRYVSRVVGVMVSCGDYEDAERFVRGFSEVCETILERARTKTGKEIQQVLPLCRRTLGARLDEAVLQAAGASPKKVGSLRRAIGAVFGKPKSKHRKLAGAKDAVFALRLADWSRDSYASRWVEATKAEVGPRRPRTSAVGEVIDFAAIDEFTRLARLRTPYWPAIAFPTRPIPQREITSRAPDLLSDGEKLNRAVRTLRGTWLPTRSALALVAGDKNTPPHRIIPWEEILNPKIAITSFEVSDPEWNAAAVGTPMLTLERYQRLNRMLDEVAKCPQRPDYVLFPECSIPRRWALPSATRLVTRGISLIAGLEYRADASNPNKLHNEVLVALRTNFPGYTTNLCLFQGKECAAWHEADQLNALGKRLPKYKPDKTRHAVYVHGGLCFGVLICSELTNIRNRALFQGKVDALFIPEWNPDLESFGTLVEAAALDVHCYIAQANNRKFSDSRMRAPFKVPHQRDVIRLKGGENDYFVVGTIDYMALRRFQSFTVPPMGDKAAFKPFPLGFPRRLSDRRRVIPESE
jgi:hypothetical protein